MREYKVTFQDGTTVTLRARDRDHALQLAQKETGQTGGATIALIKHAWGS